MAYIKTQSGGFRKDDPITYDYILDSDSDLTSIEGATFGSCALSLATKNIFVLNSSNVWTQI